jgi:uncharacterized protein (DUF2235 family)
MKRLLCFFDGTWNTPDARAAITNVVKLYEAVPDVGADGIRQLRHYEIGIATMKSLGRLTFAAGAVGYGMAERIQSGYQFLVDNYEPGDEIYLFGFSRGAYQARSLGGLISLAGILRPHARSRIAEAWTYYLAHRTAPDRERLAHLRSESHFAVPIRLVGVWDTVGNLGIPLVGGEWVTHPIQFHNTELAPTVEVGLHALSIDEPRGPFSPTLWTRRAGAPLRPSQIVEQVWFPGAHANVGGGHTDSGLSDISLLWMAERAMATTGITFDMAALKTKAAPNALAEEVSPVHDGVYRMTPVLPFVRLINQDMDGIARWRRSLFGAWRTSKLAGDIVPVNETIHESARLRFGQRVNVRHGDLVTESVYRPRTLAIALGERP